MDESLRVNPTLTLNFMVAVVNSLNTKAHSSKEMTEFCFENADVKSIFHRTQMVKNTLSLSSECMEMKIYKLCSSFTSHPRTACVEWCGTGHLKFLSCKTQRWTDRQTDSSRQAGSLATQRTQLTKQTYLLPIWINNHHFGWFNSSCSVPHHTTPHKEHS